MKGKEYSPFKMKAAKYNNSPMQKNFGEHLAMNKKIDADANHSKPGQPSPMRLYDEVNSDVNKLNRVDMEGGLTGAPSTGMLDGPMEEGGPMMMKKQSPMKLKGKKSPMKMKAEKSPMRKGKGNMGAINQASKAGIKPGGPMSGIGMLKSGINKANTKVQSQSKRMGAQVKGLVDKGAKKIGLKKTGNIGAKLKQKYSGAAQRAGKVAKPGESQYKFKTRTRKPKAKPSGPKPVSIFGGFKTYGYDSTTKKAPTAPKGKPYVKPKSKIKVKPVLKTDFTKIKGSTTYKPINVVKKTKKKKSISESIKPTPMNLPGFKFN